MKRPEKKEVSFDISKKEATKNIAYNQACEDWEKYHKEIRQRFDTLQAMYEGLKASNELHKKQIKNLPKEEEIRTFIDQQMAFEFMTLDVKKGRYREIRDNLAKTIHKRIT